MSAKTIAGWVVLALVTWWVVVDHNAAAHVVHNIGTFLNTAASGITSLFAPI